MKTLADYPYDPKLRVHDVVYAEGLEKLRYVADRGWAQQLFNLWHAIHEPKVRERVSRVHNEQKREEMVDLAKRAHSGKLGPEEQDLALEVFGLTFTGLCDNQQLGNFWRGLSALRQARANRVTGEE